MVLGNTAETLQRVADLADDVYSRLNEVRTRLEDLHTTADRTDERVARLEAELAEQRAVLDALAAAQGVDVEGAIAEAHIEEAERAGEADESGEADGSDGTATEG